jgi:hypothetical protein
MCGQKNPVAATDSSLLTGICAVKPPPSSSSLTKIAGPKSPVAATDLSLLDGILPVQTTSGKGRAQTALAMTQELFVEMLW